MSNRHFGQIDHLAGATPFGPVVDQYGLVVAQYVGFEAVIRDVFNVFAH